jgi:hypothetical protein
MRVSEKRWNEVHIHGDLLALRQIFDFKKGHSDQTGDEGKATGSIVTRFLQNFKEVNQQKARKHKVHDE